MLQLGAAVQSDAVVRDAVVRDAASCGGHLFHHPAEHSGVQAVAKAQSQPQKLGSQIMPDQGMATALHKKGFRNSASPMCIPPDKQCGTLYTLCQACHTNNIHRTAASDVLAACNCRSSFARLVCLFLKRRVIMCKTCVYCRHNHFSCCHHYLGQYTF